MSLSLQFSLRVEDGWPPVGSESLPFEKSGEGYKCLSAPLFVYDLSVGDVIEFNMDSEGFLSSWSRLSRSGRSTIWLLRLADNDQIETCLQKLRSLGCNTTAVTEFGCYSNDVPESLAISEVDEVLGGLDSELVAVAFPSIRHPEQKKHRNCKLTCSMTALTACNTGTSPIPPRGRELPPPAITRATTRNYGDTNYANYGDTHIIHLKLRVKLR